MAALSGAAKMPETPGKFPLGEKPFCYVPLHDQR
jgi:hypothetical protein